MKKIVIAGFGSAGYAALMAVKKVGSGAQITVIDPKETDLVHPCGIPYAIEGVVDGEKLTQDISLGRMGVTRERGRVISIDQSGKRVVFADSESEKSVEYDILILCPGNKPVIPGIKGIDRAIPQKLHTVATVGDFMGIRTSISSSKSAIVIGAGAIGLETSFALKRSLPEVTVVEMRDQVLPGILDPDMSTPVEQYLSESGINLLKSRTVTEITGGDGFAGIVADGDPIAADMGILSAGFRPNTDAAIASGISCGRYGINVNDRLETSIPGIFAAGDAVSGWSVIDGKPIPAKLATSAYKQGSVAGANAAGGNAVYRGSAATFVTRAGGLEIAGTGFTTAVSSERGFDPVSGKIKSGILPDYFPGGGEISIKVIFDRASGKILGAQAVGEGAAHRVNIISAAIEFGVPIEDLGRLEMAYCPAVSEVYDPLMRAVDFGLRRIRK